MLDFYGTVVHEDDVRIASICERIVEAACESIEPATIGSFWWSTFSASFAASHGAGFRTQRALERESLVSTLAHFGADLDPDELSRELFEHWAAPPIFDDAIEFLARVDVPIVVVSNIDRADLEQAIDAHRLTFDRVITSDDVCSYKPRSEIFDAAVEWLGIERSGILHVGDSLTSDVAGAHAAGIDAAWVNRKGKPNDAQHPPELEVAELTGILSTLAGT